MSNVIRVHGVASVQANSLGGYGDGDDCAWQDIIAKNKDGDALYIHTIFSKRIGAFLPREVDEVRSASVNGTTHGVVSAARRVRELDRGSRTESIEIVDDKGVITELVFFLVE